MTKEFDNEKVSQGVAFLLYKEGKFLLEERIKKASNFPNHIMVPGGIIEEEDVFPVDRMLKETLEECDVMPRKYTYLGPVVWRHPAGHIAIQHLFVVDQYEGEIKNMEPWKVNHIWFDPQDALKCCTTSHNKQMILKAIEFLRSSF